MPIIYTIDIYNGLDKKCLINNYVYPQLQINKLEVTEHKKNFRKSNVENIFKKRSFLVNDEGSIKE